MLPVDDLKGASRAMAHAQSALSGVLGEQWSVGCDPGPQMDALLAELKADWARAV
jgi:hypothetical protein